MPPVYGGLTYASVDIQKVTLFFDFMESIYQPAFHRGSDDIAPGMAGRYRRNRIPDNRLLPLQGWTRGVGGTRLERQQSWNDAEAELGALLDPTEDPRALIVLAPYQGLLAGSASIMAQVVEWEPGTPQNGMSYRRWAFVLEAIGNPPDWLIEES